MNQDPVKEIVDVALSQRLQLLELLTTLKESKSQITKSANKSQELLKDHFSRLRVAVNEALDKRVMELLSQVDHIEQTALPPLEQCEDMISQGISTADRIVKEGKLICDSNGEDMEKITRFKEDTDTRNLNSIPAIPSLSEVPCISVDLSYDLQSQFVDRIAKEGKVRPKAPIQITDVVEQPGGLLVKWSEVEDDVYATEFCLQHSYGKIKSNDDKNASFHNAYLGKGTSYLVKQLHVNVPYSFRVRCHNEKGKWSVWSVPAVATTTIPHYEWSSKSADYLISSEHKTATKIHSHSLAVLYSNTCSVTSGRAITFRVLDAGNSAPGDGVGLSMTATETETLRRPGAAYVTIDGKVYVDGREMKMKLPFWGRGSKVTFATEALPNGKLRVSVQVEEKELAFDWNVDHNAQILNNTRSSSEATSSTSQSLYFAMAFMNEDWKVTSE